MAAVETSSKSEEIALGAEMSGCAQTDISSFEDSEKQVGGIDNHHESVEKVYIDAAAESRLVRKLDTRLIPLLFVLCEFQAAPEIRSSRKVNKFQIS